MLAFISSFRYRPAINTTYHVPDSYCLFDHPSVICATDYGITYPTQKFEVPCHCRETVLKWEMFEHVLSCYNQEFECCGCNNVAVLGKFVRSKHVDSPCFKETNESCRFCGIVTYRLLKFDRDEFNAHQDKCKQGLSLFCIYCYKCFTRKDSKKVEKKEIYERKLRKELEKHEQLCGTYKMKCTSCSQLFLASDKHDFTKCMLQTF